MTWPDVFPADAGSVLTGLARASIEQRLDLREDLVTDHPAWLCAPGASFVTLTMDARLRGCIGSLVAHRPLGQDVASNAQSAAFADPRFRPLRAADLDRVRIEVSVLGPSVSIQFTDRADALRQLRPGIDGVILDAGWHRATFLPQVWDELPDPSQFLQHLLIKADLPPDHWSPQIRLARYTVTAFAEPA